MPYNFTINFKISQIFWGKNFKKSSKYSKIQVYEGDYMKYVPLYVKSHNSLLSSMIKIDELISFAHDNIAPSSLAYKVAACLN